MKNNGYGGAERALLRRFTKVPNSILFDSDLSWGAKLTWMALKGHQWNQQLPFPSQQRLGVLLGISRQRVSHYIKELEGKGLVEVKRKGAQRSAKYYLSEPTV